MARTADDSPLITAAALARALDGPAPPVVVDCRFRLDDPAAGRRAWQHERLPGARYGDLERDFSATVVPGRSGRHPMPAIAAVIERLRAWGVGGDTPVVFYDDAGGAFAARGWWLAGHAGHPHARVLDGGIDAWRAGGGVLETGEPPPATAMAAPWPERAPLLEAVTAAEVAATIGSETPLVDARPEARFSGREEPIDPVAGHIPGAVCLPHSGNLGADGTFLDSAALATRWRFLAGRSADDAICYCGSGVTASHNVLAAVAAGIGRPRLYVGSWSEWITDPDRPRA